MCCGLPGIDTGDEELGDSWLGVSTRWFSAIVFVESRRLSRF